MYKGDRSRKETLVEYGFRLPSALDNRPLRSTSGADRAADDLRVGDAGAVRARARRRSVVEQVVRPTGLVDPEVECARSRRRSTTSLSEIRRVAALDERVLITTLTKRMAEDLTEYLHEHGVKVRYLHSDIETVERMEIIRDLRLGEFDVLVGINLLREGLDMPEVSLVAILDADKEGFLRSGQLADPDDRPRGAQRERQGDPVRRSDDGLDAAREGYYPPGRAQSRVRASGAGSVTRSTTLGNRASDSRRRAPSEAGLRSGRATWTPPK